MTARSKPLCTPRVSITLMTSIQLAAELEEAALRYGTNRHRFIIETLRQGLKRLPASDTASQS